jgi:hypothetical protein
MKNNKHKQKFPKPTKIGEMPMIEINGEIWGLEISLLSDEESKYLKSLPAPSAKEDTK